jgi:hypothetical protein
LRYGTAPRRKGANDEENDEEKDREKDKDKDRDKDEMKREEENVRAASRMKAAE